MDTLITQRRTTKKSILLNSSLERKKQTRRDKRKNRHRDQDCNSSKRRKVLKALEKFCEKNGNETPSVNSKIKNIVSKSRELGCSETAILNKMKSGLGKYFLLKLEKSVSSCQRIDEETVKTLYRYGISGKKISKILKRSVSYIYHDTCKKEKELEKEKTTVEEERAIETALDLFDI